MSHRFFQSFSYLTLSFSLSFLPSSSPSFSLFRAPLLHPILPSPLFFFPPFLPSFLLYPPFPSSLSFPRPSPFPLSFPYPSPLATLSPSPWPPSLPLFTSPTTPKPTLWFSSLPIHNPYSTSPFRSSPLPLFHLSLSQYTQDFSYRHCANKCIYIYIYKNARIVWIELMSHYVLGVSEWCDMIF